MVRRSLTFSFYFFLRVWQTTRDTFLDKHWQTGCKQSLSRTWSKIVWSRLTFSSVQALQFSNSNSNNNEKKNISCCLHRMHQLDVIRNRRKWNWSIVDQTNTLLTWHDGSYHLYRQINRYGSVSSDARGKWCIWFMLLLLPHRTCSVGKTKFSVRVFIMYFGKPKLISKVRRVVRQLISLSDIVANKIAHMPRTQERPRKHLLML